MILTKDGQVTRSLRYDKVNDSNILACLTESISLEDGFNLCSLRDFIKNHPTLLQVLDYEDMSCPVEDYSLVGNFLQTVNSYDNKYHKNKETDKTLVFYDQILISHSDMAKEMNHLSLNEIQNHRETKKSITLSYEYVDKPQNTVSRQYDVAIINNQSVIDYKEDTPVFYSLTAREIEDIINLPFVIGGVVTHFIRNEANDTNDGLHTIFSSSRYSTHPIEDLSLIDFLDITLSRLAHLRPKGYQGDKLKY